MRNLVALSALACVAAGCGDLPLQLDYTANPTKIEQAVPAFKITEMLVGESKAHPGKVWVQPSQGKAFGLGMNGDQARWASMRPEIEPAYRAAALSYLARDRSGCELSDPMPHPDTFAFEFTVSCKP